MEQFPIDQIKCGFVKGVASANGSTESGKASEGSDLGGKMVCNRGRANNQTDLTRRQEGNKRNRVNGIVECK